MAGEKSTTTLNKARVDELLGYIKQTFYSQAEHAQGIKDFNAWWLSVLGQPNGVPKTDANNKILQGFFPDYILGQLLWGGTIAGNDKISPSSHLSSKIDIVDESISSSNVAKYTGIYFIATADANTSGSIVNSLDVRTGDWVISTGVEWVKIDNTDAVRSVADYVGSITAEELRNRLVSQYKDGSTYKNYALGTMHYADGSGKALQLATTEFARSILGGIASQSVFSGLYADKAKTLLTPRKLWGNDFDGSGDIDGDIVFPKHKTQSTINTAGVIVTKIYDDTGYWDTGIRITDEQSVLGGIGLYGNNKSVLYSYLSTGRYSAEQSLRLYSNGNVMIGRTSDTGYKLDVNGTFKAQGATTLNSTLLVKKLATFEKNILLANANVVAFKHTDGQSNINLLTLTQNNEALFGYGTIAKSLTSTLYGKKIQFKTKDSLANDAIIDENGNFHSYHDISATGGVSAVGINDFGIGGGSVGTGGKTYKLIKIDEVTKTTLELTATDGSQKETVALNQFSNAFAGLVPATNGAPKTNVLSTSGWRALVADDIPSLDWSKIATGKPTTISGYGITDAYTNSQIENGVFPNMRVGLADDLGDIEETLDVEYTFQPTANPNEIRDGYAQIESLKGNSLVWNQLVKNGDFSQGASKWWPSSNSVFNVENGVATLSCTSNGDNYVAQSVNQVIGHSYLLVLDIKSDVADKESFIVFFGESSNFKTLDTNLSGQWESKSLFFRCVRNNVNQVRMRCAKVSNTNYYRNIQLIDLTQMFGEGYEPTTVEEFYARKPQGVSLDYNEGEIINLTADAVKSVGFNQWDEEWELGIIGRNENGDLIKQTSSTQIRSKNWIKVLPNTTYNAFCNKVDFGGFFVLGFAETDGKSGRLLLNRSGGSSFTTNADTNYILFSIADAYGATYNHDICINISDPDKNGTYEPYKEFVRELPCNTFEGGMKSAGTAYDEVYYDANKKKYIGVQRLKEIDLGDCKWRAHGNPGLYYCTINNNKRILNAVSSIYPTKHVTGVAEMTDENIIFYGHSTMSITFCNTSISSEEEVKTLMQGVKLIYELAEPIITELDIPYMDYEVSNDGTEQVVADTPTTPLKATVVYNFDTIGTVRQNRFDVSNLKIDLKTSVASLENKISLLAKGEGVSGNWVLDGLKIGTYDVLHKGNTSLVIDNGDNFGFTLKVADTQIQMSDITEDELREMINTAWGTNYEA